MSDEHLNRRKYHLKVGTRNTEAWMYEEPAGFSVLVSDDGRPAGLAIIPWRIIRAALKRKDKP